VLGFALIWISSRPAFVLSGLHRGAQEQRTRIGTVLYRWLTAHHRGLSTCPLLTLEVEDELIPFYRRSDTNVWRKCRKPWAVWSLADAPMVYDRQQRRRWTAPLSGCDSGAVPGHHQRPAADPLLRSLLPVPQTVRLC
jgi:hypothetical protein